MAFNNSAMRCKFGRLLRTVALTGVIITTVTCHTAISQPRREPTQSRVSVAARVDHPPRLDGTLHDPLWQLAHPIVDFRQPEPYGATRYRTDRITNSVALIVFGWSAR